LPTKIQTQHIVNDVALTEIQPAVRTSLDALFSQINSRFSEPGALSVSGTTLTVSPTVNSSYPNGKKKAFPQVGGVDLGSLTGGLNISSSAGTGSGDIVTMVSAIYPLVLNSFYRFGIEIRADKKIYAVSGTIGASAILAGKPTFTSGAIPLGELLVQTNASNAVILTNSSITEFRASGGGGGAGASSTINQTAHGFVLGKLVAYSTAGSNYILASSSTTAPAVGIVSDILDSNNFVLTTGGFVSFSTPLPGVTAGVSHYLSTSGNLTPTAPLLGAALFQQQVFQATTTSSGFIQIGTALYDANTTRDGFVSTVVQAFEGVKSFFQKLVARKGTEVPRSFLISGDTEVIPVNTTRILGRTDIPTGTTIQVDGDLQVTGSLTGGGSLTGSGIVTSV
jgi:hypothetical protein